MSNFETPAQALGSFRATRLGGLLSGRRGAKVGAQGNVVAAPESFLPDQARNDEIRLNTQRGELEAQRAQAEREAARRQEAQNNVAVQVPGGGGGVGAEGRSQFSGMSNSGHGGAFGLTPKAGAYLEALRGAYQRNFGEALPINSGGRTYAEQARLYALYKQGRGNLAAPPGTSTHESGRAVDFGGRAHYEGTPQQSWLVANSGKYGFSWTGKSFSQREAWHFDFVW
jgi:hypothetical protein